MRGPAQRARWRGRVERGQAGTLARPVALEQRGAEAAPELVLVGRRRLGAEPAHQRVVRVRRGLGRGQQVAERLADIGEEGRAEVADVRKELRRREFRGQADGRADRERGRPQRHDGVAVEQRHRAVVDVLAHVPELVPGRVGDHREAALRAPHRLGDTGRPGGEQQQEQRIRPAHRDGFRPVRRDPGRVAGVVDQQEPVRREAEVEAGQPGHPRGVGDHEPAVDVGDVGGQLRVAPGGVQARHGRARQGGRAEPEDEVGHVVQQDPDVERAVAAQRPRQFRAGGRLAHHLVPGPVGVAGAQAEPPVAEPVEQQRGDVGAPPIRVSVHPSSSSASGPVVLAPACTSSTYSRGSSSKRSLRISTGPE